VRRIVHYYPRALGDSGVTLALWSWARAQASTGSEVCVLHAPPVRAAQANSFVSKECIPGLTSQVVPHRGRHRLTLRPIDLRRYLGRNDLLVLHEGWVPSNLIAAAAAHSAGVPYVVMPHGVYERAWTAFLKGPRWLRASFERLLLERAAGVHLFFDSEADDGRRLAPKATFFSVPTGFELPPDQWTGGGGYLAWVGRVDPIHKGLDALVAAFARLSPSERPLLRIHGYDYKGGIARLQEQIARLSLGRWVHLEGRIAGAEKTRFLQQADGSVHPSRWECHSLALLENLALGVPCLVSDRIHIAPTLRRSSAAVLAAPSAPALADALPCLIADRWQLGSRGRALIGDTFSWQRLMPHFYSTLARLGLS
jgi:glycosyltransferase involved in cell wall biosynthesis